MLRHTASHRGGIALSLLAVAIVLPLVASEWECPAGSIFHGSHGVAACCPAACGHCGGRGCEEREGGRQACCALDIQTAGRSCNGTAPPCVPLERSGDRHSILAKRTEACRSAAVRVRQPLPAPTKPAAFIVVTLGNRDEDNPRGARLRQLLLQGLDEVPPVVMWVRGSRSRCFLWLAPKEGRGTFFFPIKSVWLL